MAASMGPNFTGHPAGMGHPPVPGHPMGPGGIPPNAGQQGAPGGGIPHQFAGAHMGVSAPGGPMNPAMMAGMPPGTNLGMHPSMQHLTPQQQQALQQQAQQQHIQNQMQQNPQGMSAALHNQQLFHQRRQQYIAQQMQMQMQNAGGGAGMTMGGTQLNPQQMQQLRQQAARLGPNHPQGAAITQQLAMQQQQQQALQQQQLAQQQQQGALQGRIAGQQAGQPMAMSAQNLQNLQQVQQAQMAGVAQGQNPMAAQQQQQQQQQGQQGQQAQQGLQTQPGQPPGQHGQPQPPPGQQSQQQNPQQGSQAGTPVPANQQTPVQTPASTPAQPTQGPQPGQNPPTAQGQSQPSQPSQPQSQSQPQAQPQQHSQLTAQQFMLQNNMMAAQQQQRRDGLKGHCLLKLLQFAEGLSGFSGSPSRDDVSYWNFFVMRFFSPTGIIRYWAKPTDSEESSSEKRYEIPYPAIARFFHTHFSSGVKNIQLIIDKGLTDSKATSAHFPSHHRQQDRNCKEEHEEVCRPLNCANTFKVVSKGFLRVQFDSEHKLELFEFHSNEKEEFVSLQRVIDSAKPVHEWLKDWNKVNSIDGKQSPEMTKKGKSKQLKSPQNQPPGLLTDLQDPRVNKKSITSAVGQFLEVVEVMGAMNPLISFSAANPTLGPYAVLDQYISAQSMHQNGSMMNGQHNMAQAPRTPSFGQFTGSPAAGHMNLPGSPHVGGSPAPGSMQAPNMALQASQQGTSSGGPSANTSPASNKRRRPSGVKNEDDGSGAQAPAAQVNGAGNRKSATPRIQKRAKTQTQA